MSKSVENILKSVSASTKKCIKNLAVKNLEELPESKLLKYFNFLTLSIS